jgi:hypothetical protein
MKGGLLLDVVISQGAAILQLLACKDQALLVWGDTYMGSQATTSNKRMMIQQGHGAKQTKHDACQSTLRTPWKALKQRTPRSKGPAKEISHKPWCTTCFFAMMQASCKRTG